MKKRLLMLLMFLLALLPLGTAYALETVVEKNYIRLPEYDGLRLYFRPPAQWTLVTPENYLEHMDTLLARGDKEDDIHKRFSRDTLVFEAYSDKIPDDACIRLEVEEDEVSRNIWHLRHLSTEERADFKQEVQAGRHLENYDTFTFKWLESGRQMRAQVGFTTRPPHAYESGTMNLYYYNGKRYMLSYAVLGRRASRSSLRSGRENELIQDYTPLSAAYYSTFKGDMEPQLPSYTLDEAFPAQVDVGDVTVTGKVRSGAKMSATLDGESVKVKVSSKGAFTLTLPIDTPGDHDVCITVKHSKNTTRVENYTLHASKERTPLTLTAQPEELALAGDQVISGQTDPGAQVELWLDTQEPVTLTADDSGRFTHTFEVMDDQLHQVRVTASAQGKDDCIQAVFFATEYETVREGTKAFQKNLTEYTIAQMAEDPDSYVGERVKISVRVKDVTYTSEGLGLLCTYNPPSGSKAAKTPLYLTLYGYGQDQLSKDMTVTIYGTVDGIREVDGENRLGILVQYGTYLVSKEK